MALTIYHSNHLDILQSIAGHIMQSDPLDDPFEPEYFLVQNLGMVNWLQISLAQQLGIMANSEFLLPAQFLSRLIHTLLDTQDTSLALVKEAFVWPLFTLLYGLPEDPIYAPLNHYLAHKTPTQRIQKTLSLAKEIAILFDQYIVYRPNWIKAWSEGKCLDGLNNHQDWQQQLWQQLNKGHKQYNFATIDPLIQRALQNTPVVRLPRRIFIIGLSSLPPLFLHLLNRFSAHIDIHLFSTNPSRYYWGDITQYSTLSTLTRGLYKQPQTQVSYLSPKLTQEIEAAQSMPLFSEALDEFWLDHTGNPLLSSLGKVGRDHLHLLAQYPAQEIEAFSEPETPTLLGEIQRTIFNLAPLSETTGYILKAQDRSISIHKTFSAMREVEALYDQLLHLFNRDASLQLREVVVMIPDIDHYRPMIDAVFGHTPKARAIPYTISDHKLNQDEPIFEAFIALLNLPQSTFAVSHVLNFLHLPEISEKFHIDSEARSLISHWLTELNIHFAIDSNHLHALALPAIDASNTWLWGLKRLLLGYGFAEEERFSEVQVYPYIQGLQAQTAGLLMEFIETLIHWQAELSTPKPLKSWLNLVPKLWQAFFISNDDTQARLNLIHPLWNTFVQEGIDAGFSAPFPLEGLTDYLSQYFDQERPQQRFMTGAISFCTFVPMRAIPFKVVCLLGMNQKDFPKIVYHNDFNLMQAAPERGDRSRSHDDRYLFLEAILAAKETLYISYIARSIHDYSEQFPSLLIDELVRYIHDLVDHKALENRNTTLNQCLFIDHPMTAFSPQLFINNSPIQSFQASWLPTNTGPKPTTCLPSPLTISELSPKALIDFYKDPMASYCQKHFNLNYYDPLVFMDRDDECFAIEGGLSRYQLRHKILYDLFYQPNTTSEALAHYCHNTLMHHYKDQGLLPKYAFMALSWQELSAPILTLVQSLRRDLTVLNPLEYINDVYGPLTLKGEFYGLSHSQNCTIAYVGALNLKRQIEGFITHLLHNQRQATTTQLFGIDHEQVVQDTFSPLIESEAQALLTHYLKGYVQGLARPMITLNPPLSNKIMQGLAEALTTFPLGAEQLQEISEEHLTYKLNQEYASLSNYLTQIKDAFSHKDAEARLFPEPGFKEALLYSYFYRDYLLPMLSRIIS